MATSNIKASIPCDIHSVWKVVTEVENYTWRSDLSKTEVISDKRFIEPKRAIRPPLQSLLQNHISVGNLTWKTAT